MSGDLKGPADQGVHARINGPFAHLAAATPEVPSRAMWRDPPSEVKVDSCQLLLRLLRLLAGNVLHLAQDAVDLCI